jgi:hypothetical protein
LNILGSSYPEAFLPWGGVIEISLFLQDLARRQDFQGKKKIFIIRGFFDVVESHVENRNPDPECIPVPV